MCSSRPLGVAELGLLCTLCKLLLENGHNGEEFNNKMDRSDTGLNCCSTSLRIDDAEATEILRALGIRMFQNIL
jgi:hypothetical protein